MKNRQSQLLRSLRSANRFIVDNAARLGPVAGCGAHRQLEAELTSADAHAAAHAAAHLLTQGATLNLHECRDTLLSDHIAPLVAVAAAERAATAGIGVFKTPRRWAPVEEIAANAEGIADAALPLSATFVNAGLPNDFAEQMRAAAGAVREAAEERRRQQILAVEATRGLAYSLQRGRARVQVLNAMVRSVARRDPVLLAAWRSAVKPEAVRVSAARTEAPEVAAAAPTVPQAVVVEPVVAVAKLGPAPAANAMLRPFFRSVSAALARVEVDPRRLLAPAAGGR